MACGDSLSAKEKDDCAGETRPWSLLVTWNTCPAGVGKSFAVGVGERKEIGEMAPAREVEGMVEGRCCFD